MEKDILEIPLKRNNLGDWAWCIDGSPRTAYEEDHVCTQASTGPLSQDLHADVVIVGGGSLGLSTALALAQSGVEVVVLECDSIGDGASGRNGGHLISGLARWDAGEMIKAFGLQDARRLWRGVSTESFLLVDELIERHQIAAERRHGHLTAAVHPGHVKSLRSYMEAMRALGYTVTQFIEKEEMDRFVASPLYFGGVLDVAGGHLNPLAFVRGLAAAAARAGVRICEHSRVTDVNEAALQLSTASATVKARRAIVLAAHAGMRDLCASAGSKTIQLVTYIAATEPLAAELADVLLPERCAVYDTQMMIDYYRIAQSGRLIFGGLGETSHLPVDEAVSALRARIETVFPQLLGVRLEHAWCGTFDLTFNGALHAAQSDGRLFLAHGWSGHGVAQTVWVGSAIARAILGDTADFDMLASIEHKSIPFGDQVTRYLVPGLKKALQLQSNILPHRLVSF